MTCAYLLARGHDVTVFEKQDRVGGHTNTVEVTHEDRVLRVDTGFIVFNERNYPNFCRLLSRLGVESRPTEMTFSVRDDADGFEYAGSSAFGMLGSATNLLRARWWGVVMGLARLAASGRAALDEMPEDATIADLCSSGRFSRAFLDGYLMPMAAAIWSAPRRELERFPARFLLRFFDQHGMLDLRARPRWRTIVGAARTYVDAILASLGDRVRLGCPVRSIRRGQGGVSVQSLAGVERFDEVVLGVHSNEARAVLADATPAEDQVLGAMPYQANDAVLHADASLLPRRQRCWAAWNSMVTADADRRPLITYNMTILQGLGTREPLCVTLNAADRIDPSKVIRRFSYDHPLYTIAGARARSRWGEVSGVNHTHYCGAYWGNGFHEDGVNSALRVCASLGVRW